MKLKVGNSSNIIGLYGCYCHPFNDWPDHDWYHKQKLTPGQLVKVRHTGEFAYVIDKIDGTKYYNINRIPCMFPSDISFEHVSNLIPEIKFTQGDINKLKLKINNMDFIKLQIGHMVKEPMVCNGKVRFSHPAFKRKLPKGVVPCDYDKNQKLIELEYSNGDRHWFELSTFFGRVIAEAKDILLLYPDGNTEHMNIIGFDLFRENRTIFWNLIFERDLPF